MPLVFACRKAAGTSSDQAACSFEAALTDYVHALRLPLQAAKQARATIAEHDFSSARAHLIASVPGYHTGTFIFSVKMQIYHETAEGMRVLGCLQQYLELLGALKCTRLWSETSYGAAIVACKVLCKCEVFLCRLVFTGADMKKYGHMRVRELLRGETFPGDFQHAPLVAQFSSMGSVNPKWLEELQHSFAQGSYHDRQVTSEQLLSCCSRIFSIFLTNSCNASDRAVDCASHVL